MPNRIGMAVIAAAICMGGPSFAQTVNPARLTERVTPGPQHAALQPLVGRWRVEKGVFVVMGTSDRPARSNGMTTVREWVNDGKFLLDTTTGRIGDAGYRRVGYLGYNMMDRRYEWTTVDNVTTTMMTYVGRNGSGDARPIEMSGVFTDLGVTGEENVGKPIAMRTVITIQDENHHRFELYFTPPGGPEFLADRMDFTRIP